MVRLNAADRRRQLLGAAREEFLDVGISGARISSIAERAGVNQALLYRFFPSKEAMFEAAILDPLTETLDTLLGDLAATLGEDDTITTTRLFFRTLLELFDQNLELYARVLFTDRSGGFEFYQSRVVPFMDEVDAQVDRASASSPDFNPPAITTAMAVGMAWGVVMDAYFRDLKLDLALVTEQLTIIAMQGVLGPVPLDQQQSRLEP